ncbi:ParB/RepB/Spo0J family partition protein [Streptomyces sp. NPDC002285]
MSKADQLGTGRSFGQVPRGRSARGRAKAVTQGDVPMYELMRLHLDEVSPTPLNPRRNFGTEEELTRFGEELRQAQLAACVAVTRDAYLALWPAHENRVGSAKHILVNGERRYRSGVHVGLESLDFVVRDDLASSREQFINHLLKENLDREDFDVIERARGVQQLVDICAEKEERGARARAAEQLGKDRSWVTNQLSLLELPEELQAMLGATSLPERDGRYLARHLKENPGLDAAGLLEHLKAAKEAAALAKLRDQAVLDAAREAQAGTQTELLSADNKLDEHDNEVVDAPSELFEQPPADPPLLSADNKPRGRDRGTSDRSHQKAPAARDEPRAIPPQGGARGGDQTPALPWDDPAWFDKELRRHMTPEHRKTLVWLLSADK